MLLSKVVEMYTSLKVSAPVKRLMGAMAKNREDGDCFPLVQAPKYETGECIAEGGFSRVFAGRRKRKGIYGLELAIKICRVRQDHQSEDFSKETINEESVKPKKSQKSFGIEQGLPSEHETREVSSNSECSSSLDPKIRLENLRTEVKALRKLRKTSYVVSLHDSFMVENENREPSYWLILERMTFSLADLLTARYKVMKLDRDLRKEKGVKPRFGLKASVSIILEILKGLETLKFHRIIHCDIKPGNILLSRYGRVKLCDFGAARFIETGEETTTVKYVQGTPLYMPPELLKLGCPIDCSVDIWPVGMILFGLYMDGKSLFGQAPGWRHYRWNTWKKSNTDYYRSSLVDGFLTVEEVFKHVEDEAKRLAKIAKFRKYCEHKQKQVEEIAEVVKKAVVPKPKNGYDGQIQRNDLLDRITLDQFMQWCKEKLALVPGGEFGRKKTLQESVDDILHYNTILKEVEDVKALEELEGTL